MNVRGVDFTSAPDRHKPITCAECTLEDHHLTVHRVRKLTELDQFDAALNDPGPWIMGCDFPFGMPRKLIENMGWPPAWSSYVALLRRLGKDGFVQTLADYKAPREAGDKDHLRETDALSGAASPMNTTNPPVGKMFFEGAPRLLASTCHIPGLRRTEDSRIVVETYPRLAANHLIGKEGYTGPGPQARGARAMLVGELETNDVIQHFGLSISMPDPLLEEIAREPEADELDAVLCALQAAWAWHHRDDNYGIPKTADPLEGWIVGPAVGELG